MRIFWPTSQGSSTFSMTPTVSNVFSLSRSRSAALHRRALANSFLYSRSSGIVYRSLRRLGGTCIACFRPALVFHPRRGKRYSIEVAAEEDEITIEEIST